MIIFNTRGLEFTRPETYANSNIAIISTSLKIFYFRFKDPKLLIFEKVLGSWRLRVEG